MWFIQASWNLAIHAEKESIHVLSCALYEITIKFVQLCEEITASNLETLRISYVLLELLLKTRHHSALKFRIMLARQKSETKDEHLIAARQHLSGLEDTLQQLQDRDPSRNSDQKLRDYMRLYAFEIELVAGNWESLGQHVNAPEFGLLPLDILKLAADKVVHDEACPSGIIYLTLKSTMDAIMKRDPSFNLAKFSTWFRVLIQSACVSNVSTCMELIDQAIQLVKAYTPDVISFSVDFA